MTSSTTEALGSVLAALRRRARMSQRALSRASGISYTQIGDLENARGYNPSPLTLRALVGRPAEFRPYESCRRTLLVRPGIGSTRECTDESAGNDDRADSRGTE